MTDNEKFVQAACEANGANYNAKEVAKTLAAGYTQIQTANAFCGCKLSAGDIRLISAMIK